MNNYEPGLFMSNRFLNPLHYLFLLFILVIPFSSASASPIPSNLRFGINSVTSAPTITPTTPFSNPNAAPVDTVAPGQPPVTNTPSPDGSIIHRVKYGETLWGISMAYGVSMDQIRALNGIQPAAISLYAGQRLIIREPGSITAIPTITTTPTLTPFIPTFTPRPTHTPKPTSALSSAASPTAVPVKVKANSPSFHINTRMVGGALVFICIAGLVVYGVSLFRK